MGSIEQAATPAGKLMHLNFFDMACTGSHMSCGQWKEPGDQTRYKDRLEYYLWLAKLADRGKITSIFFADIYGGHDVYSDSMDAMLKGGSNCAMIDPVVVAAAMASVTESVSFGITGSTSYITPYILAWTWSSLDHMTRGRIGWNVVTSYSESAAKAMGKDTVPSSEERYKAAEEYMDLTYQLWEKSWEDGSQVWGSNGDPDMAYDPSKIHRIEFNGKYHKMNAYGQTHPSPQRTPVIFQAGASKAGVEFAGRHAEGIYTDMGNREQLLAHTKAVRAEAAKNGRDPSDVKFFAAIVPFIGNTVEEAQAKYEKALKNIDAEVGLAKFSAYTGIDMSKYPMDEPFSFEGQTGAANTITGVINNMKKMMDTSGPMTPRMLGKKLGLWGSLPVPIGTPDVVADAFEEFFKATDIDGFNIVYVSSPGSYEDVVDLLVPELQRRGLMWKDYAVPGGTFRENLHSRPGQPFLPPEHPGAKVRWPHDPKNQIKSKTIFEGPISVE